MVNIRQREKPFNILWKISSCKKQA